MHWQSLENETEGQDEVGELQAAIDLQNREVNKGKRTSIGGSSFMVYLNYFRRVPGFLKFKYNHVDSIWVDVDSIICTVTMSFDVEKDLFELDPVDGAYKTSL